MNTPTSLSGRARSLRWIKKKNDFEIGRKTFFFFLFPRCAFEYTFFPLCIGDTTLIHVTRSINISVRLLFKGWNVYGRERCGDVRRARCRHVSMSNVTAGRKIANADWIRNSVRSFQTARNVVKFKAFSSSSIYYRIDRRARSCHRKISIRKRSVMERN